LRAVTGASRAKRRRWRSATPLLDDAVLRLLAGRGLGVDLASRYSPSSLYSSLSLVVVAVVVWATPRRVLLRDAVPLLRLELAALPADGLDDLGAIRLAAVTALRRDGQFLAGRVDSMHALCLLQRPSRDGDDDGEASPHLERHKRELLLVQATGTTAASSLAHELYILAIHALPCRLTNVDRAVYPMLPRFYHGGPRSDLRTTTCFGCGGGGIFADAGLSPSKIGAKRLEEASRTQASMSPENRLAHGVTLVLSGTSGKPYREKHERCNCYPTHRRGKSRAI